MWTVVFMGQAMVGEREYPYRYQAERRAFHLREMMGHLGEARSYYAVPLPRVRRAESI